MSKIVRLRCPLLVVDVQTHDGSKPGNAAVATYSVGSAHDPPQVSGVAHFLEHLMFMSDRSTLLKEIGSSLASINAFTSRDVTTYHASTTLNSITPVTLARIVAKIALTLKCTEENLESERNIVKIELAQRNLQTTDMCATAGSLLMQNTAYGQSVGGQNVTIDAIKIHDIKDFFEKHYKICWFVVTCQDLERNSVLQAVQRVARRYGTIVMTVDEFSRSGQQVPHLLPIPKPVKGPHVSIRTWKQRMVQYTISLRGPAVDKPEKATILAFIGNTARRGLTSPLITDMRHVSRYVYNVRVIAYQFLAYGTMCITFVTPHVLDAEPLSVCIQSLMRYYKPQYCKKMINAYKDLVVEDLSDTVSTHMSRAVLRSHCLAAGWTIGSADAVIAAAQKALEPKQVADVWKRAFNLESIALHVLVPRTHLETLSKSITKTLDHKLLLPFTRSPP